MIPKFVLIDTVLPYERKQRIYSSLASSQAQDSPDIFRVGDDVVNLISSKAGSKSAYRALVLFLKRGQVDFVVSDFDDPGFSFEQADSNQITYLYTFNGDYNLPTYNIYLKKKDFESVLKDNTKNQAALVVNFYTSLFVISPLAKSKSDFAHERTLQLIASEGDHSSDSVQSYLDRAVANQDHSYLLKLIDEYDVRNDPDRVYLESVYEAVSKLSRIDITEGRELLAWYRYVLEGNMREVFNWSEEQMLIEIGRLIKQATRSQGVVILNCLLTIKKELVYKNSSIPAEEDNLENYNHEFIFPYSRAEYYNGEVFFIPQCKIDVDQEVFDSLVISEDKKLENLDRFCQDLKKRASESFESDSELEAGIKNRDNSVAIAQILQKAKSLLEKRRSNGDNRAVVIGVLAPAAAGKTTISKLLTLGGESLKLKTAHVGCDAYLHPGQGLRYDLNLGSNYRNIHIWGPGIYNDLEIFQALNHLKHGGELKKSVDVHGKKEAETVGPDLDLVITEGVFAGIDKDVLSVIDVLVCLYIDSETELTRFELKWGRDSGKGSTHQGTFVPLEFAEKQFYETKDGMKKLIEERADFVWIRKKRTLNIKKQI